MADTKKARSKPKANDHRTIIVLIEDNPKRHGSKAHSRFELYRTGMTVSEFLAAGGSRADIPWDIDHKHIKLGG